MHPYSLDIAHSALRLKDIESEFIYLFFLKKSSVFIKKKNLNFFFLKDKLFKLNALLSMFTSGVYINPHWFCAFS